MTVVFALLTMVGVGTAAADPVNNPNTAVFTVTCGTETFEVVTTGAVGHILDSTGNAVLFSGTFTTFVNGQQVAQDVVSTPGNRPTVTGCSGVTEFEDPAGNVIRIELTDAELLMTPANG